MKRLGPIAQTAMVCVLLLAAYLLLGLAAYLVPDRYVCEHVDRTLYIGDLLGDYPKAIVFDDLNVQDSYTLDNFTDAIIVNQAMMLRSSGLKGIMLLPRYQISNDSQSANLKALMELPLDGKGHLPRITEQRDSNGGHAVFYGRYWHGSTFVTRLLLAVMTFINIRLLLYVVSSMLLLWCCAALWKRAGRAVALVVPFSLLTVNVYVMQFSMQFAPVLLIALAAMLWMVYHRGMTAWQCGLLFFTVGSLTSFFDLITIPSLTVGLPLVVWVAIQQRQNWRKGVWMVVSLALWWLIGYVLTWLAKWGVASLLTDRNIFVDAYGEASRWNNNSGFYIFEAMGACLGRLRWIYIIIPLSVLLVLAVLHPRKRGWSMVVQYAVVLLVPFVYYCLMARPAWHHSWFNYRALATAVAALLMAVASMVDWRRWGKLIAKLWTSRKNATK
ncbi:MAG: hypothetical protein IK010_07670 [Bacteroidales bacterium]|nr:hypothetical protein [Bacteroidales bacterium]